MVEDAITDCMDKHVSDWGKIKNVIKRFSQRLPLETD